MAHQYPLKVIITGGREVGGLRSFAEGLRMGFNELGIPVEIIAPASIFLRWRELRDPQVLKILSTTAVFAAPFARRAICMAHSVSRTYLQSFWKILAVIVTFKLANLSRGAQLIAVSDYIAAHLQSIFNVRIDAVIHNPLRSLFLESAGADPAKRNYITYVGRFDPAKNLHRLLPAIRDILNENPGLRVCLAGDGPQRPVLERMAAGDERIEFPGALEPAQVRAQLRRSRVFISGTPTEALGISYIEALSQGCAVAMPASGGGLEIAPQMIGCGIHLFSVSLARESVASALRMALAAAPKNVSFAAYAPRAVVEANLAADSRFSARGQFRAKAEPAEMSVLRNIKVSNATVRGVSP
ncbi:MAG: glycosyltransferase family 4 protein [Terracidiphilus sp.]|jgi:glycosyltransferase involved in cell wall biosynthesis